MKLLRFVKRLFSRETLPTEHSTASGGGVFQLLDYQGATTDLGVSTVYRCVDLLASAVASMPARMLQLKGEVFRYQPKANINFLIGAKPNPDTNAFYFWYDAICMVLLHGNAYIVPKWNYASMEVESLTLCSANSVFYNAISKTYNINDMENGISGEFEEGEIIHFRGMPGTNRHEGVSVLTRARMTLNIAKTGDKETLTRFRDGGKVSGIISNDTSVTGFGEYQDEQLQQKAKNMAEQLSNGNSIITTPGDVKFTPMALSSADLEFLQQRKFTVREICRFFGVHPSFVFDDTSNNYKSAEMAATAFKSTTLNPILRAIETELFCKLFPRELFGKYKFEFDRSSLDSCDLESRVEYQKKTIESGLYTVNEWRVQEGRASIEGGDTLLVSANLKSINEINNTTGGQDE